MESQYPSKKLGIPGATPASTTAQTSFFIAKSFRSKTFSGEKDISTTFFLHSIIVFKASNPRKPGTAKSTISASAIHDLKFSLFFTSICEMCIELSSLLIFSRRTRLVSPRCN